MTTAVTPAAPGRAPRTRARTVLFIIDPQRGFTDPTLNGGKGELYVRGAAESVPRLAAFIDKQGKWLHDIDFTLDCHHSWHVANNTYWRNAAGESPAPFTTITVAAVERREWFPRIGPFYDRDLDYLRKLASGGRYPHTVWPPHCLIGTDGNQVDPQVMAPILRWEAGQFAIAGKHTKGSNLHTEHFSAVRAEVPDPADPTTQINLDLVKKLEAADTLLIAGWATSHCVANTVRDVADSFGSPDHVKKMVLLEDCTDSVPGCEAMTTAFLADMTARGMRLARSTDVL